MPKFKLPFVVLACVFISLILLWCLISFFGWYSVALCDSPVASGAQPIEVEFLPPFLQQHVLYSWYYHIPFSQSEIDLIHYYLRIHSTLEFERLPEYLQVRILYYDYHGLTWPWETYKEVVDVVERDYVPGMSSAELRELDWGIIKQVVALGVLLYIIWHS